ncbi:MAG: DegT/DnrJ/EryC1/StrS family aminotransferase [Campylobacterota bacterium]|nr:DegT/DnrJ/EryC1/StrS family aminotransferase [Campylobacterota bacterium]
MINFLDLKKQYSTIKEEINEAIENVISDTAFVGGKYVQKFEENFAIYHNAKYCIGVGNGTDALEIALWSLDLPKNSEVIVPANSFIATSEAVKRNNLKVIFADCGDDYTISTNSIKENITSNTSAIIPVHLYGQPCDMDTIMDISKNHNLKVVEDSAQAHGAMIGSKKIGTFGDLATFSFYPGKNLGAYGDGGAIITNNSNLEKRCRMYSNHGRSSKFAHEIEGINSRLDGMQAAILDVKLKYLNSWIEKRNNIASKYLTNIKNKEIKLPIVRDDILHVWHLFVVQVKNREDFMNYLKSNGVSCGIHYPQALPNTKAYEYLSQDYSKYKATNEDKYLVSIPIGEHLENNEIKRIINIINDFNK